MVFFSSLEVATSLRTGFNKNQKSLFGDTNTRKFLRKILEDAGDLVLQILYVQKAQKYESFLDRCLAGG